jgi:hypothetical protein
MTIRIMSRRGGRRVLVRLMPTLVRGNARLIRSLRRADPSGQLVRAQPAIVRRTVASLGAAARAGQPVTPGLAARVMAGQTARVLGTPRILGPVLVKNTSLRHGLVAPAGRIVRPRQPLGR